MHWIDPLAEEKAIWVQAKRGVLAILRVQPAKDLVESLMQPVTESDEYAWEDIVDKELVTDRMLQKRRLPSQGAQDSAYRLEDIRTCVCHAFGHESMLNVTTTDCLSGRLKLEQFNTSWSLRNEAK